MKLTNYIQLWPEFGLAKQQGTGSLKTKLFKNTAFPSWDMEQSTLETQVGTRDIQVSTQRPSTRAERGVESEFNIPYN